MWSERDVIEIQETVTCIMFIGTFLTKKSAVNRFVAIGSNDRMIRLVIEGVIIPLLPKLVD
jgi:hypothetical protein